MSGWRLCFTNIFRDKLMNVGETKLSAEAESFVSFEGFTIPALRSSKALPMQGLHIVPQNYKKKNRV